MVAQFQLNGAPKFDSLSSSCLYDVIYQPLDKFTTTAPDTIRSLESFSAFYLLSTCDNLRS